MRLSFINPQRYGGITFHDYARRRLSVFSREEEKAIVAYLRYERNTDDLEKERIDAALELFWQNRAENAPINENLAQHLRDEQEYINAIIANTDYRG
jgi:hypothetical protein